MKYKVYANYQVEFFDDIELAFNFFCRNLYVSAKTKKELFDKLSMGEDINYSYGFNSSAIYIDN